MQNQQFLIGKFMGSRRIAMVGVSRTPGDFSRRLWKEFRFRGYDVVPVHPLQEEIDGVRAFHRLQEVTPAPDAALLMVGRENRRRALEDCLAAGITLVWVYGIGGRKEIGEELLSWAEAQNLHVVAGHCPFMFFPDTPLLHRIHRAVNKLTGSFPR